ncbi:hypothetical protein K1T73_01455 [Roseovarius sp. SCSIO 43702]|uniref:hypothetical protein n=1 Tax=Roseovarius sp. SCSIO 43702 TaxID=2823043 RepID=UPI001C72EFD0|nr:hypothetical protein [Roseovarius sp. SCSIO 43702]QYX57108.1 hypothetical protein K1T73_01455 [Roseovarius sp. SCSIO 43702]
MKKIKTLAAASAIAAAAAAPVFAQDADTSADPFVSSQGTMSMTTAAAIAAGIVVGAIAIAAIDSSDDT